MIMVNYDFSSLISVGLIVPLIVIKLTAEIWEFDGSKNADRF